MIETEEIQEEPEEEEPLKFEELLARFRAKMDAIPKECHGAMGWLYVYRKIQDERKRQANRATQLLEGKRVFWAQVLPDAMLVPMVTVIKASVESIQGPEEMAAHALHNGRMKDKDGTWKRVGIGLKDTSWYQQVAVPASQGVGMSEASGTLSAAKILWAYGAASRFPTFGCIVRYSRLDPEGAAGKAKGRRIHYNPGAWQALFDLSETWNRMPDCYWRVMWDAFKIKAMQTHPDWPKWKVHAWGRRKMLREFLRDLYHEWVEWEARHGGNGSA